MSPVNYDKRDDVAYHGLTDAKLKELLALHGIREFQDPASAQTRFIQWMSVWQDCSQLSWPLAVELEIRSGKIRVGEDVFTGPCTVRIPSVQAFHIQEPLVAEGSFSMRFTERP